MHTIKVLRFVAVSTVLATACSKTETAKVDTTTPAATPGPAPAATAASTSPSGDSLVLVRGSITTASATQLVVKTDSASVTVNTPQPVHVYARVPSDLSHVSDKTFIGVTTVKQPDGSEKATEIHIFPEELRGLGEGSRPMAPAGGAGRAASTMTNGSASTMTNGAASTMTNGSASTMTNGSASKMTNGAASTNGKTIVVNFAGGSTTAVVPPGTTITEIKATDKKPAVGDQVVVVATRAADGSLASSRVLMAK